MHLEEEICKLSTAVAFISGHDNIYQSLCMCNSLISIFNLCIQLWIKAASFWISQISYVRNNSGQQYVDTGFIVKAACQQHSSFSSPTVSTQDAFRHSAECRSAVFWLNPEPNTRSVCFLLIKWRKISLNFVFGLWLQYMLKVWVSVIHYVACIHSCIDL